jgi:hypothetical protein
MRERAPGKKSTVTLDRVPIVATMVWKADCGHEGMAMMQTATMAKDLMFKLRLDAQDRERLDAVATHYSAPAATAIRMLIKEKYDSLSRTDRAVSRDFAEFSAELDDAPKAAAVSVLRSRMAASARGIEDPVAVLEDMSDPAFLGACVTRLGGTHVGEQHGWRVFAVNREKWADELDGFCDGDGAALRKKPRGAKSRDALTVVVHSGSSVRILHPTIEELRAQHA